MTIGEYHPIKPTKGRLYRLCYRNKWLDVAGEPMDWRYYEGQEKDEDRNSSNVDRYYRIDIR